VSGTHCIVVSAENNPYAGWQAKLFHFSCVTRLGSAPVIVVHDSARAWDPAFSDIVRAGGTVRRAPSYRALRAPHYFPRNTAGTLLHAAALCGASERFIVLCDPDMIFVRAPEFPEALSAASYDNMNYDRETVRTAAGRLGVSIDAVRAREAELSCGVPYVIPVDQARALAQAWLAAIDAFPSVVWGDMMHAFGLAVVQLGLRVTLTRSMQDNYRQDAQLAADVVHYPYGDSRWNKRDYRTAEAARLVWEPKVETAPGTVLGEIIAQIRAARQFYRDPFLGPVPR
jgi:hypothetical protein